MNDVVTIRRANLAALASAHGQASVAKRMKKSTTQISDTIAGRKSFGEKVARSMERAWDASLPLGWMDFEGSVSPDGEIYTEIFAGEGQLVTAEVMPATQDAPPEGYIRLDHLPYQPSMGGGRAQIAEHVVQHIDVLESFVRQKVGTVSPDRIKILTGVGTSMLPRIKDQDIVFVDIEHRWIDAPGYYVIDVGGLLLLKKAMILSTGVLILRSENIEEYPDEERHDLRKAAETITVCGKVLAWWTLMQG